MIIYSGTYNEFHQHCLMGDIADILENTLRNYHVSGGTLQEYHAWQNSLSAMDNVLELGNIPEDIHISIEFQIPLTSKRIDFLISGFDDKNKSNVIIVELKQWEDANATEYPDLVNTFVGQAFRNVTHPSYQAKSYADTILNFNQSVSDNHIHLYPCAFLHNFPVQRKNKIDSDFYKNATKEAPLFFKEERLKLANFIQKYIKKTDQGQAIVVIDHGKIHPTKALQDVIVSLMEGNQEFILLDDQKVSFERIFSLMKKSQEDHKKRTILVKGGPGTGKSVLAINLLAKAIENGYLAAYVTKNSAPRNVYFEKLRKIRGKYTYIRNLFQGSGQFVDCKENTFDFLICDEAHRLNEKSGMFANKGINQIKEIIHASLTSVFFLDDDQIVTTRDIGSSSQIEVWAKEEKSILYQGEDFELSSQFRCNGSDGYIAFLDNMLGIRKTANPTLEGLDFDFRVYGDLLKMKADLQRLNIQNKARMVAGYCYNWISKKDPSLMDINIGDFHAQWNFSNTLTWAIDMNSFEQVGCIHTCQGLEFDYVGVIIGKDLIYRDGKVLTDWTKRASTDQSLKGIKSHKVPLSLADKIIRDTYKVLLTRGQKACYVYIEDEALRNEVKRLVSRVC